MELNRRRFIALTGGIAGWGMAPSLRALAQDPPTTPEAESLFGSAISIDALMFSQDYSTRLSPEALEAIRTSRQTAAFWDISVSQRWYQERGRSFDAVIRNIAHWNEELLRHQEAVVRALSSADIEEAKRSGRFAIVYLSQDGSIFDREIESVRMFYDLGLRVLQITHNSRNLLGDGYQDRQDAGLSNFGIEVIERCNELGILVDLSHCGDKTTLEAIQVSRRPCAFTHAGCRSLYRSLRNRTDEQIRALADKGGVMGVFNISNWLTSSQQVSVEALIDHIDHVVQLGGIDHVGFGSDRPMEALLNVEEMLESSRQRAEENIRRSILESVPAHVIIPELNKPRRMLMLTDALLKRGYRSYDVEKIIGGNFLRLLREVIG